jgi:hypothetical protein
VGTITKAFSAFQKAFSAFQRSTSKELKVFVILFGLIFGWLGVSFIWDICESWASIHLAPSEHLRLAKEICEVKKDGKVFCVGSPEAAIEHLQQIPANAPEYDEATRLLNIFKPHAKQMAEEAEAERTASAAQQQAARAKAAADRVRLLTQTEDESRLQMYRNVKGQAHDPFVCQRNANNTFIVTYDSGNYWWPDNGRCAEQEEKEQQAKAQAELEKRQAEQRQRDQEAELSSYWSTTIRVDTDMDSFWLNNEERTCQTFPDAKGRVATVSCNSSPSHKEHNIPVQFWGGVDRHTISDWKCRREKDDFVCRAID